MRRLLPTTTPPLDDWTARLLLTGSDPKRGHFLKQLLFANTHPENYRRIALLWRQHETFLLDYARRHNIARRLYSAGHVYPADVMAFFGEYACARVRRCDEHRNSDDATA